MQTEEPKKIVIKLPQLKLKSLLSVRFFSTLALVLLCSIFVYWYQNVRPYLFIADAHVEAYSSLISSHEKGQITQIHPQEGDEVQKGDLLFSFDKSASLDRRSQLSSCLKAANQKIDLENRRMTKAMESYLALENIGSVAEIETQLKTMEEAQWAAEEATKQAASLESELSFIDQELKKESFFAPFDGVILKRYKNEGTVILSGDPVYSLCDLKRVWIEAEISEREIGKISVGTLAKIRLNAYPKKEWQGKVSYIGPATKAKSEHLPIGNSKATIPIKIIPEDQEIFLKPGLSAKIDLKVR